MGLNWAEHTVEIDAPIETCFAAIIDYETFPSWQGAVVDTEVLDWDSNGRGQRVRLFIDAKVRKVDYTLVYSYDQPTRIEWDFVEGNGIDGADGHYLFEELGDGRTRATYKLGLGLALPLPGPVARIDDWLSCHYCCSFGGTLLGVTKDDAICIVFDCADCVCGSSSSSST